MLLGGLWHGAAWNFVLWGFYQGCALCIYRLWRQFGTGRLPERRVEAQRSTRHVIHHLISGVAFFVVMCYGWLLFRAHSLMQIIDFSYVLIFDFGNLDYGFGAPRLSSLFGMILLLVMEIAQYWTADVHYYRRLPVPLRGFLIASMIAITMMGMSNEPAQFIYFQF